MSSSSAPPRRRHESADSGDKKLLDDAADNTDLHDHPKRPKSRQFRRFLREQIIQLQRRIPLLKRLVACYHRLPPRLRMAFFMSWVLWKVFLLLVFMRIVFLARMYPRAPRHGVVGSHIQDDERPVKILYIVTALAEYNTGQRATKRGQDRLGEVVLPIIVDGVESMVASPFNYDVDVFLVLGYTLREDRRQMIADRLPEGVGLEVWDDASPAGYSKENGREKVKENTRALSRQHRFVVKDKLRYYDLFLSFEDDMRITGEHVQHFLRMSSELDRLRNEAPREVPDVPENMDPAKMKFFGQMTQRQMKRLIPGFVRVEVLLNEEEHGAQTKLDPIPTDFDFPVKDRPSRYEEQHIDPTTCCHVPNMKPNLETPARPYASDVIIWETGIKALSVRHIPGSDMLDWTVMLPGPGKRLNAEDHMGGYWSGRDGAFGSEEKPTPGMPNLIAQQGGWMATREQIIQFNKECMGSFLPPFSKPIYNDDGHESMNVEFWSGGYQLFTGVRGGCNMQRLVSLNPDHFSKHLIYHVANNKQRQLSRERMVKADNLFGQLNTVKKAAEKAKAKLEGT